MSPSHLADQFAGFASLVGQPLAVAIAPTTSQSVWCAEQESHETDGERSIHQPAEQPQGYARLAVLVFAHPGLQRFANFVAFSVLKSEQ
jgi:hypothetical protein